MVPCFYINPRFCLIFPYLLQVKNGCFDCKKTTRKTDARDAGMLQVQGDPVMFVGLYPFMNTLCSIVLSPIDSTVHEAYVRELSTKLVN